MMAAAERLTDKKLADSIYKKIAFKYDNTALSVIKASFGKLSNQALVEVIVNPLLKRSCGDSYYDKEHRRMQEMAKDAAIEKLADQNLLGQIAMSCGDYRVCEVITMKLSDQDMLTLIAKSDGVPRNLRMLAARKLTDRSLIQSPEFVEFARQIADDKRQKEEENQINEAVRRGIAQADREERCRHDIVWDPEELCDFCKCLKHTGTCRICGHRVRHICT
jgi:hypothetical protein